MRQLHHLIIMIVLLLSFTTESVAKQADVRTHKYTVSRPLVFEDSWTKAPYAYINNAGQPDGYNITLVKEVMRRLRMPYEVRMKAQNQVHQDLTLDSIDLSCGVIADYNASYAPFGRVTINLQTQSMLVLKTNPMKRVTSAQLRTLHPITKVNSRLDNYYKSMKISDSLYTAVTDIEAELMIMSATGREGIIWNTLMLKWLLKKYKLTDTYTTIPVDIPPGEYRFMSHDTLLLHQIDSVLTVMKQEGVLQKIEAQMLFDKPQQVSNRTIIIIVIALVLLAIIIVVLIPVQRYKNYHNHLTLDAIRQQMDLVLKSNTMRVFAYFPTSRRYAWMTNDGVVKCDYNSFQFSRFFPDEEFDIINGNVVRIIGEASTDIITTPINVYQDDERERILNCEVSIQGIFDGYGKTTLIVGVMHDVTDTKASLEHARLRRDCYMTLFNILPGVLMLFNKDGIMTDISDTLVTKIGADSKEDILQDKLHIADSYFLKGIDLRSLPQHTYYSQLVDHQQMVNNYSVDSYFKQRAAALLGYKPTKGHARKPQRIKGHSVFDVHLLRIKQHDGTPAGHFLYLLDNTMYVKARRFLHDNTPILDRLHHDNQQLRQTRELAAVTSSSLLLHYTPTKRTMLIRNPRDNTRRTFTQMQLIRMLDAADINTVFRCLQRMDKGYRGTINVTLRTRLTSKDNNEQIVVRVTMQPTYNDDHTAQSYVGICTNVTKDVSVARELSNYTEKMNEVKRTRQSFMRNISHVMRDPLNLIHDSISQLAQSTDEQEDAKLVETIRDCTDRLIRLTNDTMLLSRIEAGEEQLQLKQDDFVTLFHNTIEEVQRDYVSGNSVTYDIISPVKQLPLHYDADALRRVVYEIVALSATYTHIGTITVRYSYDNGELTISVTDTSRGLPPRVSEHLFESNGSLTNIGTTGRVHSGLEMNIARSLCQLMNGSLELSSTPGLGTEVYVRLPLS